jgi:hypothetical protein
MTRSGTHPRMQRLGLLARRFGFDVLIVVASIESALDDVASVAA